jgi:pimeloyl-ACP methyl ester carboxylesterase
MVAVGLDEGDSEMTTGAPTLLLIHGFLDDATVWDGLICSLPGNAIVRYDLPGFGKRSEAVEDACSASLESLAAEAGEIVSEIGGPVIVVGQSLGTQVAELVAAQHADRVCGLVLLTPVPLSGTQLPDEAVAPLRAVGGHEAQRAVRVALSPHLSEEQLDRLVDIGAVVAPDVAAHYVDLWNNGVPGIAAKSAYEGPVRIVRGEADGFVTEQMIDAISPRFSGGVDVEVITDGGHWVHVEYPDEVASMIREFTKVVGGVPVAKETL